MKILLLVDDYFPDSIKVAAVMMHDLAKELKLQGHDVTVCTPSEKIDDKYIIDEYDGIRLIKFRLGSIKNVSKIRRAINETLLSYMAWRALKGYFIAHPQDLIVFYSPTIFFGRLVNRLKIIWKCKSFLILRDFFPQWTVDNGLIKDGSLIHRYFKFFESLNYDSADVIAVQSPSNKIYFQANPEYVKYRKKLDVLYNWSDLSPAKGDAGGFREQLGLNGKVIFFYGGNIGHAQDMMNIVRLAQSLNSCADAHFLLVGKGDEVELIQNAIQENGISNITYMESVSQDVYQKILMEIDIGLFSLHKDHKTHNFPGKLLGYMKYSKPILGSINNGNDLAQLISDSQAGFVTVNGEDEMFYKNALKLVESLQLRNEMGVNAFNLLNNTFSVKTAASQITSLVDK